MSIFGQLAALDRYGYDPEGEFKDTFAERFGATPMSPAELAALRTQRSVRRPAETSQETIDKLAGAASDVLIPKTPLDVGLTLATLPVGPLARPAARAGALALGALFEPSEAQAHNAGKLAKAVRGWTGPIGNLAEAGHLPRGTHANWYLRHDPKGNVAISDESGPTGNVYSMLKGTMSPAEMERVVTGAPSALRGVDIDMAKLQRQNAELVFGPTDKAAGGDWLQLPGASIRQEAGINFPFMHANTRVPGMPADVAPLYASVSKGAATGTNRIGQEVLDRGGVPYYVPTIMGPGAADSTNQMAFSTLAALRHAKPGAKAIETIDKAVRAKGKGAEGYPGFDSPKLDDWLTTSGLAGRRAFTEGASARSALDATGVDVSLLRYANTDPRLRHTPSGSAGIVMGRMRPDVGVTDYPLHSNYPYTFMGQRGEIGGLPGNMPFSLIAPDMHRALLNYRSPGGGLFADTPAIQVMRGLAGDVPKTQKVTDEVVENWGRWFEKNPQGWVAAGATPIGSLAALTSSEPAEAGVLDKIARAAKGIKAYHGSPHDFDRFDLSKIGTGEGAQAYGHGLYFAEKEAVAKGYRDTLSGKNVLYSGKPHVSQNAVDELAHTLLYETGSVDAALAKLKATDKPDFIQRRAVEWLQGNRDKLEVTNPGKMYEVNLNARPEQFLDWDKKVRDMPAEVQTGLSRLGFNIGGPDQGLVGSQIVNRGIDAGGASRASASLREAGIPGIRYLDQGSRQVSGGELIDVFKGPQGWQSKIRMNRPNGEQYFTTSAPHPTQEAATQWAQGKIGGPTTSNYVVFDPGIIDILRKYGLAGAGATGFGTLAAQDNYRSAP